MRRFRTDTKLEADGVWLELEYMHIKIARASESNRPFKEYMTAEHKKIETALRVGMVSGETSARIMRGAFAETIIRDWETITDEVDKDGNAVFVKGVELLREGKFVVVPPSPAAYLEYIADPANSDTYKAIRDFSLNAGAYVEIREAEAKN